MVPGLSWGFFYPSRRRHARCSRDWSSDVCSSDLVTEWDGEPHPKEDQAIAWQALAAPLAQPMLPANAPVLASLELPAEYAITNAAQFGTRQMLARLGRRLEHGFKLLQVREARLASEQGR